MIDHGDALAEGIRFEHVVRRQQNGLFLGLKVPDNLPHFTSSYRIKTHRRFVKEEHFGIVEKRPSDVQALLHPA